MKNTINQKVCKKCKLCIEICPCNIIEQKEDGSITFIAKRESTCLECAQCMAVCSSEAIKVNGFDYETDLFKVPKNDINYQVFLDFLQTRRSVRNFKDKPVPDEMIQQIVDSVSFAPFGSHPQKMHITVVNDRKKIASALPATSKFLDDIVGWMENPIATYMIRRKKGQETINTLKNHLYPIAKAGNYKLEYGDRITRDAPAILIFHAHKFAEEHHNNSMIYATYTMLAAHSLGLGATIIGLIPAAINKVDEVREIFEIPEDHEAIISVIIGYPKYKYKKGIRRKTHHVNWLK